MKKFLAALVAAGGVVLMGWVVMPEAAAADPQLVSICVTIRPNPAICIQV